MNSVPLQRQITRVRHRLTFLAVGTGTAFTLTTAVTLLIAGMLTDWLFVLSWPARAVVLFADCAIVCWFLYRRVLTPLRHQPDNDDVALFMERSEPGLGGRLISSVQLTRSEVESPTLVRTLVAQTETIASGTDFASYVSPAPFARAFMAFWIVTTMAATVYIWARPTSDVLLKRILLSSAAIPHKTTVICITGNRIIAKGECVILEASANGRVPGTGTITLHYASGRIQTFSMTAQGNRFSRVIDNVQETFRYTIHLGDGVSDVFRIEVQPRPALAAIQCEQTYPTYTKLPPVSRRLGDLSLLAGSRLRLTARATKPIQSATLQLLGSEQSVAMLVTGENVSVEIPIPAEELTWLRVQLLDTFGLRSSDDVTYRVDVLLDRSPEININFPLRREEMVTATATVVIGFETSDDYGIARVLLHSRLNGQTSTTEFDLKNETARSLSRRYEWSLAAMKPPLEIGSIIEYWLEARDNNDITGPGVTLSERYFARVVTPDEKRAELLERLDDSLRVLLNTAQEQERLNQDIAVMIREKQPAP